jgi:hypothetical protein
LILNIKKDIRIEPEHQEDVRMEVDNHDDDSLVVDDRHQEQQQQHAIPTTPAPASPILPLVAVAESAACITDNCCSP